jgi:hypothetical protein
VYEFQPGHSWLGLFTFFPFVSSFGYGSLLLHMAHQRESRR